MKTWVQQADIWINNYVPHSSEVWNHVPMPKTPVCCTQVFMHRCRITHSNILWNIIKHPCPPYLLFAHGSKLEVFHYTGQDPKINFQNIVFSWIKKHTKFCTVVCARNYMTARHQRCVFITHISWQICHYGQIIFEFTTSRKLRSQPNQHIPATDGQFSSFNMVLVL